MRVFLLLALLIRFVWAESTPEEAAQKAYLANINALMVFTTKEGLNSGVYEFTRANTTMYVLHLPLAYQFDAFKKGWNLFVIGSVGYSETTMTTELNRTTLSTGSPIALTTTNMLQTFVGGVGGGVRYREESGISASVGAEVLLSRVGITNRDQNQAGDIVEGFFKGKFNDNISYRLFLMGEYRREWSGFQPYATLSYELYETKSAFNFSALSKFTTQTSVTSFAIGSESPPLIHKDAMYLTLEGYLRGSYLGGDITKVVQLDGYGTVGGVGYWYVKDTVAYVKRFYLEVSTIQADGLRGYNVGIGLSLDY